MLAIDPHVPEVFTVIQLAVAPVFLLTAIGTVIAALNIRLGRAVDRRRDLEGRLPSMPAEEQIPAREELAVIARRIATIWAHRRRGRAGSRLHVRLVALFSVLAVTPAIVVAAFSALFFYLGVQSWFSERVSTAIEESLSVAQAYLEEHQQTLRADALSMANDLNRESTRLQVDENFFNQFVNTQAILRGLRAVLSPALELLEVRQHRGADLVVALAELDPGGPGGAGIAGGGRRAGLGGGRGGVAGRVGPLVGGSARRRKQDCTCTQQRRESLLHLCPTSGRSVVFR